MALESTGAVSPSDTAGSGSLALLARAQAGDRHALDELIRRYLPRLKQWVRGRLPDDCRGLSDTDDLVQETLINVVGALGTFEIRHEAGLQAYFRQALWNRLREEIRRANGRGAAVELQDTLVSPLASALDRAIGAQALGRYEAALLRLDDDERSAVVGRLEFGYTYPELALMLGRRTPDAARKLVERALWRIAEGMKDVG